MLSPSAVLGLSVMAAAVPTLFYTGIIYWFDRYEKEPLWLIAAAFLWGAVPSIAIAFVFNTILSIPLHALAPGSPNDTLAASLIAPPVEETLKGIALIAIFFLWRHEIDSPLDGIIYGAMVGMGFAMVENVYYFVNIYNSSGLEAWRASVLMRAFIFGLNHALFSSITGLGIAIARMSPRVRVRYFAPLIGWMGAVFLHFVHNFSVSSGNLLCLVAIISDWGGIGLTLLIIVWVLLQERSWLKKYLAEEVALGTLTVNQYHIASSGRRRSWHALSLLASAGPGSFMDAIRFYQRCSKLAYKKHHLTLFPTDVSGQRVTEARRAAVEIGHRLVWR